MTSLADRISSLPEAVRERCRLRLGNNASSRRAAPVPRAGTSGYILYWMRLALRGHENPALDAAVLLARDLGLPVLVYQGLGTMYPFPSDRHHRFILEGARDVQRELRARGIAYALHVERTGHGGRALAQLVEQAAVLVTEDTPLRLFRDWTEDLSRKVATVAVDTSCVLPLTMTPLPRRGGAVRAFEFRQASEQARNERLPREWQELKVGALDAQPSAPELPFEPVDLSASTEADLDELIAACAVDHTVPPVAPSVGGSVAGYERWQAFATGPSGYAPIDRYAGARNDPLAHGVSRMSAYLHYGMVSPLRLAREAAARGGAGADKYLDELLIWRELAHAYCFHQPQYDDVCQAVPQWAQDTVEQAWARMDEPTLLALPTFDQKTRGRTGDMLWDAAQHSLLRHGELHNNVRMTWGKALVAWGPALQECWLRLVELNHRFALDGRDPSSYGGLLWCLGQFDRPFSPPHPKFGTLRARPTSDHQKRLDVDAWRRETDAPSTGHALRIAVVGAGLAGLTAAQALLDQGHDVTVVDKGRGPGGRLSSRRFAMEGGASGSMDHGAQYFTIRDRRFGEAVGRWLDAGVVEPWFGQLARLDGPAGAATPVDDGRARYVGVPRMSALTRYLAESGGFATSWGYRVERLERQDAESGSTWWLHPEGGGDPMGPFDLALVAVPAPQAVPLLKASRAMAAAAEEVEYAPCLAAMVRPGRRLDLPYDGGFVPPSADGEGQLSWVCRNSSKPGRGDGEGEAETWVLHGNPAWSERHFDDTDRWEKLFRAAFAAATGAELPADAEITVHRWRYSLVTRPAPADAMLDEALGLGACGDWCAGDRVEGAYLSGAALAGRVLRWDTRRSRATASEAH